MNVTPFTIAIAESAIADLRQRLTLARFPDAVSDDWSQGQKPSFVRALTAQWLDDFDWRAWERRINAYPQFLTEIDGQTIHFLHIRSSEPNAIPLILTHGWPSSFLEFISVIGPLTDPKAHARDGVAFDLVIPSLPGYGFSTPLAGPGWDPIRTAKAWDTLMKGLDYERYGAAGGDAGALVTRELAILKPEGLLGVHLQQVFAFPSGAEGEMDSLSPSALLISKSFSSTMAMRKFSPSVPARWLMGWSTRQSPNWPGMPSWPSGLKERRPTASTATCSWPIPRSTGSPRPAAGRAASILKGPGPEAAIARSPPMCRRRWRLSPMTSVRCAVSWNARSVASKAGRKWRKADILGRWMHPRPLRAMSLVSSRS